MPERLQIRLLGGFEIALDDRRLSGFQSLRFQRFLALVTLRDGAQQRSRLAFELWPDSGDAQARTNLRKLLHEFRQTLPDNEAFIEINSKQVRWRETARATVDVLRFREAVSTADYRTATANYTGDLLPACYDDWVLEARASLRTDALAAFTKLMDMARDSEEPTVVLAYARQVLELEPTDEAAICHKIEGYCALGDRNAAMRAYHRYADAMERELGVAPSEAVRALYQQIRNGFAQPDDVDALKIVPSGQAPAAGAPFVGRDREIAELQSAWTAVQDGSTHLVLVTGEPGIGKSRLAHQLGRHVLSQGHSVASTRAYEAAGRLPWGPVVDLLRSKTLTHRIDSLDTVWRAELSRLLPELTDNDEPLAHAGSTDPAQRHRLFDAVGRALVSPDRPRLLIIDDLQWCDVETIEMIGFVIRSDPGAPVLIVGTVRSEEIPKQHPLIRVTDALELDGAVTTLLLEPLDMTETAMLAARMREVESVDPDFAMRLWTETTGNPLFLIETLRAGTSPERQGTVLTPTIRAVMRARLNQLSEDARHLAEMSAVIGRAFSIDLIATAMGTDEHTLIDAVDELWMRRIISEQGVRYDFSHDKLREVALEMISPARQRLLHRAAASALSAVHSNNPVAISPQLADHYDRGGMVDLAIEAYRTAGASAVAVSAFEQAVAHFSRALTLLWNM